MKLVCAFERSKLKLGEYGIVALVVVVVWNT